MHVEMVEGAALETWDIEEVAAAWAKDEIVLIDVRTIQEYGLEHVERGAAFADVLFRCK